MSPLHRTAAEDRVTAAYEAALDHIAACSHCRAIRLKQTPPDNQAGVCPDGDRLLKAHKTAKRQARQEGQ